MDGAQISVCDGVYEPREDSYLLADAVEEHARGRVLDLGTGSGIQGITAAMKGCDVTFSDINGKALECAHSNATRNGVDGKFAESDMFGSIHGKFDTIIFNPPYLPSRDKASVDLDGGKGGRELIDRFIASYKEHLEDGGIALLLESSLNGYSTDTGKGMEIVRKSHYFFEDLVVLLLR